jgi:hypothetical protein
MDGDDLAGYAWAKIDALDRFKATGKFIPRRRFARLDRRDRYRDGRMPLSCTPRERVALRRTQHKNRSANRGQKHIPDPRFRCRTHDYSLRILHRAARSKALSAPAAESVET